MSNDAARAPSATSYQREEIPMNIRKRPLDWGVCMSCREARPGVFQTQAVRRPDGTSYARVVGGNGMCMFCRNGVAERLSIAS
jgi:hypothetical protein